MIEQSLQALRLRSSRRPTRQRAWGEFLHLHQKPSGSGSQVPVPIER